MSLVRKFIRYLALEHGKLQGLYVRLCRPRGEEYAEFLKRHGRVHSIGENNCIQVSTDIVDPEYVRIGDNCIFSTCALIGHDASVAIINRRFNKNFDAVGKIDIRDNCFIGYGAVVLPGVTIGPNAIVAAGAVVSSDVGEGEVVGGVPAKLITRVEKLVHRMEQRTNEMPWKPLIDKRGPEYDPTMEPELVAARVRHLFGES